MRLIILFVLILPILGLGQLTNSDAPQADKPTSVQRSAGQIDITIQFGDSIDVVAIDSILVALDSMADARKKSKIYGHDIFRTDSVQALQPNSIVKVPDSYVLGVGDELAISIFGVSQFDAKYKIDANGFISPDQMPKVFLRGLTWLQTKKQLIRRFSSYYRFRPEQMAVVISRPRTITVNIFGEVEQPGSYNLVATNTAFNALIAAGGPTEKGSVRKILITNGSEQKELDVYELMSNPLVQFQYYLEDNVVIQVPSAKNIVSIEGAVQRPFLYEILEGEGLQELLGYAGGLQANAVKEVVQIKRYQGDMKVIRDVNLNQLIQEGETFLLKNGDEILIRSIISDLSNAVAVEGAVENPGEYAIETTLRVSDLIDKGMLKRDARTDIAFLVRQNPDSTFKLIQIDLTAVNQQEGSSKDLLLEPKDRLVIPSQKVYADPANLKVSGAVRKEIEYPFDPDNSITLEQAILLAGGLAPEAEEFGYIIRGNVNNKNEKEYIRINVFDALVSPLGSSNIVVEPWDEVVVLSKAAYSDSTTVSIRGAVRIDSSFQYDPSLTIRDVIALSGGLSKEASGILDVYRRTITKGLASATIVKSVEVDENYNLKGENIGFKLESFDQIVARSVARFELQSIVTIQGQVEHAGAYALLLPNERLLDVIKRAGGLSEDAFAEGVYVLRHGSEKDSVATKTITSFDQVIKNPSIASNLIIMAGDVIVVPKKEDVVYINLKNTRALELFPERYILDEKIAVSYTMGKTAKWYIDSYAGGFGEKARKDIVTVEFANGAMQKTKGFAPFRKYPKPKEGATISIGSEVDKNEEIKVDQSQYPKNNKGVIAHINGEGKVVDAEN